MLNDDNEEGKLYSKVNLTVNSGIIAQINSHLMTFFKDFYGVLVGSHKVKREIRPSDKKEKNEITTLYINIEDVIIIFKNEYTDVKLEKLFSKIIKFYSPLEIVGVFSARKYSYPKISLKGMKYYMKANDFVQNVSDIDSSFTILFGLFTHNQTLGENGVKAINFNSKFYYYNKAKNIFDSIPYETLNLKETTYDKIINFLPNKVSGGQLSENFGSDALFLKSILQTQMDSIEKELKNALTEQKISLKKELDNYSQIYKQYKQYNQ